MRGQQKTQIQVFCNQSICQMAGLPTLPEMNIYTLKSGENIDSSSSNHCSSIIGGDQAGFLGWCKGGIEYIMRCY